MRYRINRRTGDSISEIGLGSAYIFEPGMDEAIAALRKAYDGGVNFFDLATGDGRSFAMYREALEDVRGDVFYQIAFGADYSKGVYGKAAGLDSVKRSIEWQLEQLGTDYIDYGFIHCIDTVEAWENFQDKGIYEYMEQLKDEGVIRHMALSSHTPAVIDRIMDDIDIDLLMFSVNAAYDYGQGDYAKGSVDERGNIFRRCEKSGTGISVMKTFAGGQLLDAALSPFGRALTRHQCIKYALDKPGVLTVLPGIRSASEVDELLEYYDQPDEALDYSVIGEFTPVDASGKCVYCNHCQPCPAGLDVGLINKYYDLAQIGDDMAADHYRELSVTAADCTGCGHCDQECPFSVEQSSRMTEIREYFEGNER